MPKAAAQPKGANYDESKVPQYTLPDPLVLENGRKVTSAKTWRNQRRPEIVKLFETHVYGRSPARPAGFRFKLKSSDPKALEGKATRKEILVQFGSDDNAPSMEILLYVPNHAKKPAPAFLGLNFSGNHAVHSDPKITLSTRWMRGSGREGVENNRATEKSRGSESSRWAVEKIIDRGYGLATIYYGDLEPDFAEGYKTGIRSFHGEPPGSSPDLWGAIGAWAWGLSRALDVLQDDADINSKQIAVIGHSRLGKTALWAGAQDERFAIVISNNSGCGGAALSKRRFGETVERINTSFPHWFNDNFKKFNDKEELLPLDQHMLVALCAPRPVYIASAEQDLWADPKGEFLAARHAHPVYKLLGAEGLPVLEMPPLNQPVMGTLGYHIRSGKHDVTDYDWDQYLAFADKHFRRQQTARQK